jgi:uncharacterized protein (TIGR02646 family)
VIPVDTSGVTATPQLAAAQAEIDACADAEGPGIVKQRAAAWQSMTDQLSTAQASKCAYCEDLLKEHSSEVDHVRPKQTYWWLAFKKQNLLYACRSCNNAKSSKWEVQPGVVQLRPKEDPWSVPEPSCLVDPTGDDPDAHLTFVFEGGEWRIAGRTPRGTWTIANLELDRDSFTTESNWIANEYLAPEVARLKGAIAAGDDAAYALARDRLAKWAGPDNRYSQFVRTVVDSLIAAT